MTSYERLLAHLFRRANAGMKLDLEATRQLLHALEDPHAGLRCIVVGGTNGKGSTAYTLARALQNAGLRTGLYTSPHLRRFGERIQIDAQEIGAATIAELYDRICRIESVCSRPPTFFECATAIALTHFAEQRVDLAVLEVGLGGRLDATNVVAKELAVLTPISLDHTAILGGSLAAIAWEKAHILPPGGLGVCAPQPPDVRACVDSFAAGQHTKIWHVPSPTPDDCLVAANGVTLPLSAAAVPYIWDNLQVAWNAWCALKARGLSLTDAAFATAARNFAWPGRYEWLAPNLLVDCAHNDAGIAALLHALTTDPRIGTRALHCVFSALRDKTADTMVADLRRIVAQLYLCPVSVPRSRNELELRALAPTAPIFANAKSALDAARTQAERDGGVVLVTGSMFLVADVLRHLHPNECDPAIAS